MESRTGITWIHRSKHSIQARPGLGQQDVLAKLSSHLVFHSRLHSESACVVSIGAEVQISELCR